MFKKVLVVTLVVLSIFFAFLSYVIYQERIHRDCGLSVEQAKKTCEKFLVQKDLPIKYLEGPTDNDGSCSYNFHYNAFGEEYSFIVLNTWLNGVKLLHWDHSRGGDGP